MPSMRGVCCLLSRMCLDAQILREFDALFVVSVKCQNGSIMRSIATTSGIVGSSSVTRYTKLMSS
jgi:hypothetical protein